MVNITSIAELLADYHQTDEYRQKVYTEKLLFFLHYAIIIPFILFLLSRMLRCLRHLAGYRVVLNAGCTKILKVA